MSRHEACEPPGGPGRAQQRRMETQVLIIGAGPAGSSAARALRSAGIEVVLADRCEFPRDKVCGDALIPDSLEALEHLGLRAATEAAGRVLRTIRIYAPNGRHVELHGDFVCLPRREFDALIQSAAVEAGAVFLPGHRAVAPLVMDGVIAGARLQRVQDRTQTEVRAQITLLATGAAVGALRAFGVCERVEPSAIALRTYYRVPQSIVEDLEFLSISYDRSICPGYGWIFPGPEGVFNLGVGFFCDSRGAASLNARALWSSFARNFEPAARIAGEGEQLAPLRGAPLRTAMTGARLHRPGLLVLGEAAGLTYSFSGEGIGKAMASGLLAAEILSARLPPAGPAAADIGPIYERQLRSRYGDRFRAYRIAQDWLARPAICNLIAERAGSSERIRRYLESMLTEKTDPGLIFSVAGLMRLLWA
ncbi:MAG: geranylgeranyl reductase family protein [Acidobacteria bacterium]|nr:geranylgeranyl reductase family protein [Acidobacteriota bacterium]